MPFNTRNPIPSGDLRDLDDNARNIDTWANDKTKLSHPDRLGVERRTWHGIEQEAQLNIQQAIDAKNAAQEAAMMSGFSKYADTLAQLEAGIGTDYVDGDVVMVFQDESRGDTSSIFKIESGAAEFKLTFDKTRQDLLSFTGTISADAEWSDVPAHSDPAFDVQAQALANRTQVLNKRTEGLLNVRAFIDTTIDGVTSNQDGIEAAVAAAYAAGAELEWPAGTYVSTGNIPHFHAVRHSGLGFLKRGGEVFHIGQSTSSTNVLYVSPGGNNDNDGLSANQPFATLQKAVDSLSGYGPLLRGVWSIRLSSGTYSRVRFPDNGLQSEFPIEISGPEVGGHPNIPTAIISEGANGVSAEGVRIRNRTKIKCSNIHFIGFNGTSSSGGLTAGGFCDIYSVNCHYTNCTWGISGSQHSLVDVKGGIFDGCGFGAASLPYPAGGGIRGLFLTKFSIGTQNAGSLANGPIFKNGNFGVFAQEHIDGHVDWCTFEGNRHHVRMNTCSRLNLDGSSFKRATGSAIWAQYNSVVSFSGNNTFGTGADANYVNLICNSGGVANPDLMMTTTVGFSTTERCIARKIVNQTVNSTGNTIVYKTTLKGQLWRDGSTSVSGMKKLRFKMFGTLNGTAGFKRPQMRFGATQLNVTFTNTETGPFECEGQVLINTNPIGNQVQIIRAMRHLGSGTRMNINTTEESLIDDTDFNIEALVENSADSIVINAFEVWVDGI